MAIQNDNTLVTKGDLKALYSDKIAPYLGANLAVRTNVSDYYSEDEKIVGVWTDGKPVYQKTIVTNTGSSGNATYSIASWNIDKIINYNGVIEQIVNEKYYYPNIFYNADSTYHCNIYLDRDNSKVLNIRVGSGYYNYDIYITIQYTKITDIANSATATPGCYDINFPNTWPKNTEIYFGNGLYGYRYVPNDTISCPNARQTETYPLTDLPLTTRLRNIGGCLAIDEDNILEFPWCYHDPTTTTNNSQHGGFYLSKNNNKYRLTFYEANATGSAQTLRNIDVWATYTK